MDITYLPGRLFHLAKSVNGGPFMFMSSHETREQAEAAQQRNEEFHLSRCPKDSLTYSINQ